MDKTTEKTYEKLQEEAFSLRLSKLRLQKGVSARDMSLSIGQNPGYINNIETGKTMPSMSGFFYICDYLQISPQEFFNTDTSNPKQTREVVEAFNRMDSEKRQNLSQLIGWIAGL